MERRVRKQYRRGLVVLCASDQAEDVFAIEPPGLAAGHDPRACRVHDVDAGVGEEGREE
jgi:hypothetical protein